MDTRNGEDGPWWKTEEIGKWERTKNSDENCSKSEWKQRIKNSKLYVHNWRSRVKKLLETRLGRRKSGDTKYKNNGYIGKRYGK